MKFQPRQTLQLWSLPFRLQRTWTFVSLIPILSKILRGIIYLLTRLFTYQVISCTFKRWGLAMLPRLGSVPAFQVLFYLALFVSRTIGTHHCIYLNLVLI